MYVNSVAVHNFKCFKDTALIALRPGFNFIVGPNNSGKTALLEALSLSFGFMPFRGESSRPEADRSQSSTVEVDFTLGSSELGPLLHRPGALKLPKLVFPRGSKQFVLQDSDPSAFLSFLVSEARRFSFRQDVHAGSAVSVRASGFPALVGFQPTNPTPGMREFLRLEIWPDGRIAFHGVDRGTDNDDCGITHVLPYCRERIYLHRAEKVHGGTCPVGPNPKLWPNCSNLPEVLNILQSNPADFRQFNDLVTYVLPQIRWVSVAPSGQQLEIHIWNQEPKPRRQDLSIPLSACGTGTTEVLSILYIVMSAPWGQTMLIDEPTSFLHPGATRKLLEIMRDRSDHQYVVSTHSPVLIQAVQPNSAWLTRYEVGGSTLHEVDLGNAEHLSSFLREVGVRLSDVFGADNVIWVEGETEEDCFPIIVRRLLGLRMHGSVFRAVRSTDELTGKKAATMVEIYGRLTGSASLFPPALGFIFDLELRDQQEQEDLRRRGIRLLGRRMYENYLLIPGAICNLLTSVDQNPSIEAADVARRIESCLSDPAYYHKGQVPTDLTDKLKQVHGAKVLSNTFAFLTETRVQFQKTLHGPVLTEWIAENEPKHLKDVAEVIRELLNATRD